MGATNHPMNVAIPAYYTIGCSLIRSDDASIPDPFPDERVGSEAISLLYHLEANQTVFVDHPGAPSLLFRTTTVIFPLPSTRFIYLDDLARLADLSEIIGERGTISAMQARKKTEPLRN